jgi:eukaryotic-like serine/threonine-protein kinase
MQKRIVEFLRKKDYRLVESLARGGFGKTVLLEDEAIGEFFVCKKYEPYDPALKEAFFGNFVQEVKILYKLNHPNIVRVFSYHLYPEHFTGYILMEHVKGESIKSHSRGNPQKIESLFLQMTDAFEHLHHSGILHRDIRDQNFLVGENNQLKVIDFGFGKKVETNSDHEKSISLNWQYQPPEEFGESRYDFSTEVYFLGMLFKDIIEDCKAESFGYKQVLAKMCQINPRNRFGSFSEVRAAINGAEKVSGPVFNAFEIQTYRTFANHLEKSISKIERSTTYESEVQKLIAKLENLYQSVMLEQIIPAPTLLTRCFISGSYYFNKSHSVPVTLFYEFLKFIKSSSPDKQKIILSNLHSRLDGIERYGELDDEVPF